MSEPATVQESHSCHVSESPKLCHSDIASKSDLNFIHTQILNDTHQLKYNFREELYKRYELDEIPVKDSASYNIVSKSKDSSLCDSDLDRLENRIFKNVSQELQTDESSFSSLDSNFKFFKSTVEKIFENFNTSMSDFEHYKKRFNNIIAKSKEGSVDDMEEFIRDMFENILSGESSVHSAYKPNSINADTADIGTSSGDGDTASLSNEPDISKHWEDKNSNHSISDKLEVESVTNSPKLSSSNIDDIFNILLVSGKGGQSLEIKLNCRAMLSEIQLKEPSKRETDATASADDLKKVAAKKLQVERYIEQALDHNVPDRNIPVKVSFPKKDIHLNEDFTARMVDNGECNRSLLGKICGMLCKKFRKNTVS